MTHTVTIGGRWPIAGWVDGVPLFDGLFVAAAAAITMFLIFFLVMLARYQWQMRCFETERVDIYQKQSDRRQEIVHSRDEKIEDLEIELSTAIECLDTTKGCLREAQDKIDQLTKDLADEKQWRKLESDSSAAKLKHAETEILYQKNQNDHVRCRAARSEYLWEKWDKALKVISELNHDIAYRDNMIESLRQANKSLHRGVDLANNETRSAKRLIDDLVGANKLLNKQLDDDRLALSAVRKDLSRTNTVINDIRDRLNDYANGEPWIPLAEQNEVQAAHPYAS